MYDEHVFFVVKYSETPMFCKRPPMFCSGIIVQWNANILQQNPNVLQQNPNVLQQDPHVLQIIYTNIKLRKEWNLFLTDLNIGFWESKSEHVLFVVKHSETVMFWKRTPRSATETLVFCNIYIHHDTSDSLND